VLAMGVRRGWRSALAGTFAASLALAVIVAALGPALTVIPIEVLRLVVGALLLVFGLQWLRKAILRASGWRALRDEDSVFEREAAAARAAQRDERARMRRFGAFWWDFVVGDDWRVAVGIALALGLTALLATTWASAWIVLPLAVAAVLWISLRRAAG